MFRFARVSTKGRAHPTKSAVRMPLVGVRLGVLRPRVHIEDCSKLTGFFGLCASKKTGAASAGGVYWEAVGGTLCWHTRSYHAGARGGGTSWTANRSPIALKIAERLLRTGLPSGDKVR